MSDIAILIENLSKQYRLGRVGTGALYDDLNRWWSKIRGKEDPFLKIGETNDRARKGLSNYVWALRDINLEVKQGEVLGIIGKNGSGKSTLLKVLSKVTGPTTGRVMAKGRIASLLEVGTGFHPELTGRENIFLNGAILGMTKQEVNRKLDEIVDFAGVERYIDTPVKRYSSGMTVRLGFAVAAFLEEEILIVDEVLAVGDAEFQKKAIGKMQEVSKSGGRTVLFVSHNMASIQMLCTKTIILKDGNLLHSGNTEEVINHYMRQLEELSTNDLANRKDRVGNQLVHISSVRFLNGSNHSELEIILSGTPVLIEFNYTCKDPETVKNLRVAIAFSNILGGESFVCDNFYIGIPLEPLYPKGSFFCFIPKWPLNKGDYQFRIHVESNNTILDRVENAGKVTVEFGDFFGSGFIVPPHLNGALVEHQWFKEMSANLNES